MKQLNKLEMAVLDWVSKHACNPDLAVQLESAVLTDRVWTKGGLQTQLKVGLSCIAVDLSFPITGPHIESPELTHGAGSLIWGNNGFVNGIEMFAYGDEFAEGLQQFSLGKCPTAK